MEQNENIVFNAFVDEKLGVQECSKCLMTHETLEWKKYITPVIIEDTRILGWAMCPLTNEPILFIEENIEENDPISA